MFPNFKALALFAALAFTHCLAGPHALANVCEKYLVDAGAITAGTGAYALDRGTRVKLQAGEQSAPVDAVFLGRLISIDNSAGDMAFYEPATELVHIIPKEKISISRGAGGEAIATDNTVPVVRSVNQEGPTCSAYSMFNCLRQMSYWGHEGNSKLRQQLADEAGRLSLVVRTVSRIYTDRQTEFSVLQEFAQGYGFKVYQVPYNKAEEFRSEVLKYLRLGWPVLMAFDVPSEMSTTSYTIVDHTNEDKPMDRRIWKPKGTFQSRHGGHMILAVGAFEVNGKTKILVSDPNWQVPRMWDLADLDKAKAASMQAYVVWEEKPAPPVSPR